MYLSKTLMCACAYVNRRGLMVPARGYGKAAQTYGKPCGDTSAPVPLVTVVTRDTPSPPLNVRLLRVVSDYIPQQLYVEREAGGKFRPATLTPRRASSGLDDHRDDHRLALVLRADPLADGATNPLLQLMGLIHAISEGRLNGSRYLLNDGR